MVEKKSEIQPRRPGASLIHTGLQPGVNDSKRLGNRFNGFPFLPEETHIRETFSSATIKPLKRFPYFLGCFPTGLKPRCE